jgi:uncharacterized repeat protein (TIGR01451 family)
LAASTNRVATQLQGWGQGGIDGKVHQDTGSSATNFNQANQNKVQSAVGGTGSTQTQFDPMRCCGVGSQAGGNARNQESIGQGVAQTATENGASQTSALIGESLSPNGSCDITQGASTDDDSANNHAQESPCPFLVLVTSCNVDGCTAFDPVQQFPGSPESQLTKCARNINQEQFECTTDTSASSGQEIGYQITYSNVGDADATGVVIRDVVPQGMTYVDDSCSGPDGVTCSYNPETSTVTWNVGTVNPDNSVPVTFIATFSCSNNTPNIATSTDEEEDGTTTSNPSSVNNNC